MYLSYFYKHAEMTIRLGYFWVAMTAADIIAAVAGAGLLRMRGVLGYEGWRWMFLIEVCQESLMYPTIERRDKRY